MDSSDLGQLRRLLRKYGPRVVLRECSRVLTGLPSLFIAWLNGLQTEAEMLYICLGGLKVPELHHSQWDRDETWEDEDE